MSRLRDARRDQLALFDPGQLEPAWQVRESVRARRLTVRVLPGGRVEVVGPPGTHAATVQRFVARHRRWIERKVADYGHADPGAREQLPAAVEFQATATRHAVEYPGGSGAPRLVEKGGGIVVMGDVARIALARHVLQRWLLRTAHGSLVPWLQAVAAEQGLTATRIQVRRQRTRWGSCSRSGTLSVNACLMFQRPAVVRYLFLHELAHTRHMDHSRAFWRLVESLEPGWRALDRELATGWRSVPHWAIG